MAEHVLSLSYGKDSLACLGAIEELGWPLDRIIHVEVWATDTIPADLPPMVEFKEKADAIIKGRYGIEVEHYCAKNIDGEKGEKVTYQDGFYHVLQKGKKKGTIKGFPMQRGPWCQKLKLDPFKHIEASNGKFIQYLGIAVDEPGRFSILSHIKKSPLVEAGWTEQRCREWCEDNSLLSPIYTDSARGGCWFCHNQGIQQLRMLRRDYPEYWALMLKWDDDSPVTFKAPSTKKVKGPKRLPLMGKEAFERTVREEIDAGGCPEWCFMPTGAVIATAELVSVWRIAYNVKMDVEEARKYPIIGEQMAEDKHETVGYDYFVPSKQEITLGDWTPGRYAWKLANVKILPEPIPVKGKQGLWNFEIPKEDTQK